MKISAKTVLLFIWVISIAGCSSLKTTADDDLQKKDEVVVTKEEQPQKKEVIEKTSAPSSDVITEDKSQVKSVAKAEKEKTPPAEPVRKTEKKSEETEKPSAVISKTEKKIEVKKQKVVKVEKKAVQKKQEIKISKKVPPVKAARKIEVVAKKVKIEPKKLQKKRVPEPVIAGKGGTVHKVIMPSRSKNGNSQFNPVIIRIKFGESIEWINEDERTHFINSKVKNMVFSANNADEDEDEDEEEDHDDNGYGNKIFNSPVMRKGDKWVHQFTKKGVIEYYCFTHPLEMVGKIIIE